MWEEILAQLRTVSYLYNPVHNQDTIREIIERYMVDVCYVNEKNISYILNIGDSYYKVQQKNGVYLEAQEVKRIEEEKMIIEVRYEDK